MTLAASAVATSETNCAREASPHWTRLSDSPLWQLQRRYFCHAGVAAWRDNVVPSFVTSNAFIARAYAEMALAWRQDTAAEPLTVIELGAGSGRFAHFFLKHALAAGADAGVLRYVMTDVSHANLAFWRGHDKFAPFVASGMLDFALFDPGTDASLQLEISGAALGRGTPAGATMAIANYVFDGIEQDAFETADGTLHECMASLRGVDEGAEDLDGAELIYARAPCAAAPYADPAWNAVLDAYRELPNCAFLMPVGAFRVLDNLRRLADAPLLLLAVDKGTTRMESWRNAPPPRLVRHGSVSVPVNFHALAMVASKRGGTVLEAPMPAACLNILGFAFDAPGGLPMTRQTFERAIVHRGPDDLYVLKKGMERNYAALSLAQMIAFLRITDWDPSIVSSMYDPLADALPNGSAPEHDAVARGLMMSWDRYLPLGEDQDFAFQLGNLIAAMGRYAAALHLFETSRAAYGDNEAVEINIGLCRRLSDGVV